jgi:uncharacterized protein
MCRGTLSLPGPVSDVVRPKLWQRTLSQESSLDLEWSSSEVKRLLLAVIGGYRTVLSPVLPPSCRFHPSCSEYACEAVTRHGTCRGLWLTARRLLRCHPWHPGGIDPVP